MEDELNRELCFQRLSEEEKDSFYSSPAPVLIRFEGGQRVWKWTGPGGPLLNGKGRISAYWAPWDSVKMGPIVTPGFKEFRMRHQNSGGNVGRQREAAKALFAVSDNFGDMTTLLVGEFKKPVWGMLGKCAGQRKLRDERHPREEWNVWFIGGEYQVVIPKLTTEWIKKL